MPWRRVAANVELPLQLAKADYESRLSNWEQWQPVAVQAQG